jgi:hypothetical protein
MSMKKPNLLLALVYGIIVGFRGGDCFAKDYSVVLANYTNSCNGLIELNGARDKYGAGSLTRTFIESALWHAARDWEMHKRDLKAAQNSFTPARGVPEWVGKLDKRIQAINRDLPKPPSDVTWQEVSPGGVRFKQIIQLDNSLWLTRQIAADGTEVDIVLNNTGMQKLKLSPVSETAGARTNFDEQAKTLNGILGQMKSGKPETWQTLRATLPPKALLFLDEERPPDSTNKAPLVNILRSQESRQIKDAGLDPTK